MKKLSFAGLKGRVSWGSVFGGVMTVLAISVLLSILNSSIGLFMFDPLSDHPVAGIAPLSHQALLCDEGEPLHRAGGVGSGGLRRSMLAGRGAHLRERRRAVREDRAFGRVEGSPLLGRSVPSGSHPP